MFDFPNAPTLGQLLTGPNGVQYKWDGIKWTITLAAGPFLPLSGGTLSGPLFLNADPTANLQAATKQYVDTHVPVGGGILEAPLDGKTYGRLSGNWTPVLPIVGGTITGNLTISGNQSVIGTTTLGNVLMVNATANVNNLAVGSPTVPSDALAGTVRMGSNVIVNEITPAPIFQIASNAYETNSGAVWKYLNTGTASVISNTGAGTWNWYNAVSGSAGAVVPWVARMTLAANGDLSTTGGATFAGSGNFNGGTVSLNGSGAGAYASLTLNCGSGGGASQISGLRVGSQRWLLQMPNGSPDGAANAGSDFAIYSYDNSGTYIGNPFSITRASGLVFIPYRLNVGGDINGSSAAYATNGFYAGAYGDTSLGMYRSGNYRYFQFSGGFTMRGDVSTGNVAWIQSSTARATLDASGNFGCALAINAGSTVSAQGTIRSYNGRIISDNSGGNPSFCCFDQAGYSAGMFLSAGSNGVLYLGRMNSSGDYIAPWYAYFTATDTQVAGNFSASGTGFHVFNGPLSLGQQSYGIRYDSGYIATHNTINFGWYNVVAGCVSWGVDNGAASGAFANASDERIKLDIQDSSYDALATINQLQTREFTWLKVDDPGQLREARGRGEIHQRTVNEQPEPNPRVRVGLVAQEVNKVFPEGVIRGDDFEDRLGLVWGLDQNVMIALLVGAVQQLTARVNELEQA